MKIHICIICLFLLLLISPTGISAQEQSIQSSTFVHSLIEQGFENVGIQQSKSHVYIFYENRRYRWEIDGLAQILKAAANCFNDSIILHIVPMHHQVPVSVIKTTLRAYKEMRLHPSENPLQDQSFHVTMNSDSLNTIQKNIKFKNKTNGKIDLYILPGMRIQFGNYDNPFEKRISISPILQTSLWKGMLLSAEVLIPLYNDLLQTYEGKIRLETATLNQLFRLPNNLFIYSSIGIFPYLNLIYSSANFQRYGITTDIRKCFLNGRISMGGNIGLTGIMNISDGYLNYWPFNKINFTLYGEYRNPRYDFTSRISAGKFLYEDYAVRVDLFRQFHELKLGLFFIKSNFISFNSGELGMVGGVNISIPLSPRKAFKPAPFRVNLANYFSYEMRDRSLDPLATSFSTDNKWNESSTNLNPDFVKKHLVSP